HFTFLHKHADVLRKLGEDDFRIFNLGNPALDKFVNCPRLDKGEVLPIKEFNIGDAPYLVLIQHPILAEADEAGAQMQETLSAIHKSGYKCFINYPNSDPGNFAIIEKINEYTTLYPEQFSSFKNLDRLNYINLLRYASCLIGNSSSGIVEAPSIGLPVINIGLRQRGRFSAGNVIYTEYDSEEIYIAIIKSVTDIAYRDQVKKINNPYGDGNSAGKISEVLSTIQIDKELIHKNITYKI
ncbi:UDP-N-acetylglucosamine 2-epimerase, partial [Chitinophaga sp.]|uniref:UDP-N-acetylglucosamine 2-epimerase n=1 Tax=Chitinophaga sp. TaxID=1869181 RepID=UPI002F95A94C